MMERYKNNHHGLTDKKGINLTDKKGINICCCSSLRLVIFERISLGLSYALDSCLPFDSMMKIVKRLVVS